MRLSWNTLARWGEQLHDRESITLGMRAVLEFLSLNGPTSVPNIARSRRVTRQHIQALINPLLDDELVEATENPAHQRSSLMRLTAEGKRTITRMRRREATALRHAKLTASSAELQRAAATLRALRRAIDS